jgi:hypothetical protein
MDWQHALLLFGSALGFGAIGFSLWVQKRENDSQYIKPQRKSMFSVGRDVKKL